MLLHSGKSMSFWPVDIANSFLSVSFYKTPVITF